MSFPFLKNQKKISFLDITLFFRQFSTLISAGVPIVQCCEIIKTYTEKASLRSLIYQIKKSLETGKGFSDSLRQHQNYFNELTCALIDIGEQTGTLDRMLVRIVHHQEKSLALKNKVKHALFYPAVMMVISLFIFIAMLIFIVPRFAHLFQSMHKTLPFLTRIMIHLSEWISHYCVLGILLIVLSIVFNRYFFSFFKTQIAFEKILLKLPILSSLLKKMILARFAQTLATTFSSGIPIIDALKMASNTCGNHFYAKATYPLQREVAKGQPLHIAMRKNTLFPSMMIQLIQVGEESGKLEPMLEKIATLYETEMEQVMGYLSQLIEPLIMVVLGVLIGGLVIAMYLPIFKLGTII